MPLRFKFTLARTSILIAVLGAAAVVNADLPNKFADNEVLTHTALNANFDALDRRLAAAEAFTVPAGAVVAFNLAACPVGWEVFVPAAGRAVIGVNPPGASGGLSARPLGQLVGQEQVVLTIAQMPSHNHNPAAGTMVVQGVGGTQFAGGAGGDSFTVASIGPSGGNQPHENMQPSIALLYCEKSR